MSELSAERTSLAQLWEEHMRHEFQTCSTEDTLATMVENAYVNHARGIADHPLDHRGPDRTKLRNRRLILSPTP
jgi:hypothetical protein